MIFNLNNNLQIDFLSIKIFSKMKNLILIKKYKCKKLIKTNKIKLNNKILTRILKFNKFNKVVIILICTEIHKLEKFNSPMSSLILIILKNKIQEFQQNKNNRAIFKIRHEVNLRQKII